MTPQSPRSAAKAERVILLVSHAGDDHLGPVVAELRRTGAEAVVIDTSTLPVSTAMSAAHSNGGNEWRLRLPDGTWLDLGRCHSGWWRRALPPVADPRVADPAEW